MAKRFVPTEEQKRYVKMMTAMGIPQKNISRMMQISVETLAKAFRHEIAVATDEANAKVAGVLFREATEERNVTAMIFWLKTRARWVEPKQKLELSGDPDAPLNVVSSDPLSPEEWAARYVAAANQD